MLKKKKAVTSFRPQIRSRHPSHRPLRSSLQLMPFRSIIRFGSTTDAKDTIDKGGRRIEINTVQGIKNSSNKLLMKKCFSKDSIKTADWCENNKNILQWAEEKYPIVAKHHYGSRGRGNYKLDTRDQLEKWMKGRDLNIYLFERFIPFKLEYRFHINTNGCFYSCRKALKENTPKELRWVMNDSTCVWYTSDNERFMTPNSFKAIEEECIKALKSLELDFCAFDVRVQSELDGKGKRREFQDFFIVEGNSAPSLKERGLAHYNEQIPIILNSKWKR